MITGNRSNCNFSSGVLHINIPPSLSFPPSHVLSPLHLFPVFLSSALSISSPFPFSLSLSIYLYLFSTSPSFLSISLPSPIFPVHFFYFSLSYLFASLFHRSCFILSSACTYSLSSCSLTFILTHFISSSPLGLSSRVCVCSPFHVVILDEIDAICKPRGRDKEDIGNLVYDSLVNQLLTKLDGLRYVTSLRLPHYCRRNGVLLITSLQWHL